MLVTTYITNYNYGDFIKKAVDSVLNQTFQNFELIIIDDGSTDHSKEVIESYRNHPKVSIVYQHNKGLNVTNNIAIRAAQGKYIMRLDADDYLSANALEILSEKLEENDELGLVFPDYFLVDKDDRIISEEIRHDFDGAVKLLDQPAHGACTMIRLEFLKEVGGYNEAYNCQDGYELWVKFIHRYKVSNVNMPLFYYRQHGKNLTSNENRILDTRAQINANYIKDRKFNTKSLVVIPIRGGKNDLAYEILGSENLLMRKINQAMSAENVVQTVVSSPDPGIKKLIDNHLLEEHRVVFHLRGKEEAEIDKPLAPTVQKILEMPEIAKLLFDCICILTVEFPFLKPHKIDDAINTMVLFGSDSLISVRPDNSMFYQHHGDGMHAILNRDKYTKLEREALFKQYGGITACTLPAFRNTNTIISGIIGHMVIDQESSLGIFTDFDRKLATIIYEQKIISQA